MIIQFLISFLLSVIFLKSLMSFLKKFFLDIPNNRSSHVKPIPRAGGISFVIVGCFFAALNGVWIPLVCLPLSLVSLIDDFRGLKAIFRYITQTLTCLILLLNSNFYHYQIQNLTAISQIFLIFLFVLLGTAIINFMNFMDGIDGILASCMAIVFGSLAIINFPFLFPFVGAIIGFLIFNWEPAKVFMGDLGSTFLGSVFVGCIFQFSKSFNDLSVVFISSPLLFDAFSCVIRRFSCGDNIFKSHKLHLYQRLHQAGISHKRVSLIYLLPTILLSLFYLIGKTNLFYLSIISTIFFGIFLEKKNAYPFKSKFVSSD